MSTSYQDIDIRLKVVEDKLDFVMQAFKITKRTESTLMPGEFITEVKTLKDVYQELAQAGLSAKDIG